MAERLGVGKLFLMEMDTFAAQSERYEENAYQRGAAAIDKALLETMRFMRDEEAGDTPAKTRDELAELWQSASRAVEGLNRDLSLACYHKALGWIRPEMWDEADKYGINTSIEAIQTERLKLRNAAKLPSETTAAPPASRFQWITDKEHRERVTFLITLLTVIVGGLWTAFVYFDGKAWVLSWFNRETIYYVCMGEHQSECRTTVPGSTDKDAPIPVAWVDCYTDLGAWAKKQHPKECVFVRQRKLSDIGGNRCGYYTGEVICTTRW
jgi:hypothetical protein